MSQQNPGRPAAGANSQTADAQHQMIGVTGPEEQAAFQRNHHPDAQWFGEAGLGLFLHWGISSVSGLVDLSWGMVADTPWDANQQNANKLSPNEYYRLADQFNPEHYNPRHWLQAAAAAGFKYAILTTRHHDGYALWPSQAGELGVRTHLGGRDLVAPFVAACRECGLKVGLYYSPPDWYWNRRYMSFHYGSETPQRFPGRCHYDMDHQPVDTLPSRPAGFDAAYRHYARTQIEELLTQYGQIDVLFFDGGPDVIPFSRLRELQPGMVVNPRMHGYGDYATPECRMPDRRPEGWWELCEIWNNHSWAYHKDETYKETSWMLSRLCQVRAWGGNYLINVAPRPDGELPATCYSRLAELQGWVEKYGAALWSVEAGQYPDDSNMPYTRKGSFIYAFLRPGEPGRLIMKSPSRPRQAVLMWTGRPSPFTWADGQLTVDVPDALRTSTLDVVRIEYAGDQTGDEHEHQ